MLCTFNLDVNKRCVLFCTKLIFRSGTKSWALIQHLSPVQKKSSFIYFPQLVFLLLSAGCTYQEPTFEASGILERWDRDIWVSIMGGTGWDCMRGGWLVSDHSTRGRSSVVLEVLFRSQALSSAEIQSEIVLEYLHNLDFCTV